MIFVGVLLGTLMAAQSSAAASAIAFYPEATIEGRTVKLGAVADLSALPAPLRARAEALDIAILPPGQRDVVLDSARIAERARTQLPALAPLLTSASGPVTLRVSPAADRRAGPAGQCARLERPIAAGDFLLSGDLQAVPCDASIIKGAVRLDAAAGAVRARRDLTEGDLIVAPPTASLAQARPGQALRLTTIVGSVAVEREVTVSRPARAGAPVFVKAASGPVFTAPPPREARP